MSLRNAFSCKKQKTQGSHAVRNTFSCFPYTDLSLLTPILICCLELARWWLLLAWTSHLLSRKLLGVKQTIVQNPTILPFTFSVNFCSSPLSLRRKRSIFSLPIARETSNSSFLLPKPCNRKRGLSIWCHMPACCFTKAAATAAFKYL